MRIKWVCDFGARGLGFRTLWLRIVDLETLSSRNPTVRRGSECHGVRPTFSKKSQLPGYLKDHGTS